MAPAPELRWFLGAAKGNLIPFLCPHWAEEDNRVCVGSGVLGA